MLMQFNLKGQCLSGKNHMQVARNGKHYPLKRWAAWRDDMLWQIRRPKEPMIGWLKVRVVFTHANNLRRDVPGLLDALCHVLEHAGVVNDDSQIIQWDVQTNLPPCKALAGCAITLETL